MRDDARMRAAVLEADGMERSEAEYLAAEELGILMPEPVK